MSNHEKLFEKIMASKETLKKLADAETLRDQVEMILELGMEHGLPVERHVVHEYFNRELSDEDLESVAGGKGERKKDKGEKLSGKIWSDDYIEGFGGDDTIDGGLGDDTLKGGSGDDSVDGGWGNDRLDGGKGDDSMDGGLGDDTMDGGKGDDTMKGGWGSDTMKGGDGNDEMYGSDGTMLNYDGNLMDGGDGNDYMYGGNADDTMYGGADNDEMHGGWGDDSMDGGDGNDVMDGGLGDDYMKGGDGNDHLGSLTEMGDDTLHGEGGDDTLYGGMGDDILRGGDGNDVLDGGIGHNTLTGGDGADTFSFRPEILEGNDVVTDFNPAQDKFHFQGAHKDDLDVKIVDGNTVITFTGEAPLPLMPDGKATITLEGVEMTRDEIWGLAISDKEFYKD